ncbi:MAG: amidohydrolase family protein [Anaerolineae bacterium]|nr:amidohydrolase family protein [Anaerolineae bacterium]
MKIIDSHMHLWNPALLNYAWLEGEPVLKRPFLPADFRAASAGLNIESVVFVQADCLPEQGVEEVKWVTQIAPDVPVSGIVAFAPLEHGDAARPTLQALTAYPLVKGVRRLIQSEAAGFSIQPDFIKGVQAVADYGFSFDLCIRHHQLADVIHLVTQCPNVSFILDHVGKPAIAAGEIARWRDEIQSLAQHENVHCKLSGMVTEANYTNWTADDLRPYVEHVLNIFGTQRIMFGSDWPVSTLAASYQRWLETAQQFVSHLSADDQQRIFYENAKDFYRLESSLYS